MESLDTAAWLVDDLLDFSGVEEEQQQQQALNVKQEDDGNRNNNNNMTLSSSSCLPMDSKPLKEEALPDIFDPNKENPDFFPLLEEELEWLSNENAFPSIETFLPMKPNIVMKQQSPVSVKPKPESSSVSSGSISCSSTSSSGIMCCGTLQVPVRARSSRRRRRPSGFLDGHQWSTIWSESDIEKKKKIKRQSITSGRKCTHCLSEKTPQWRAGPLGPKTLCNACGVRYKSGRLVPEYRPACSPTFTTELHSNSHKKVLEMRKLKQQTTFPSVDAG
ncbi:hypothetical protein MKW94_029484 [Papaver nudicaule]|uniref:GATA-type domain-containing protein n=1 Tax=Papaver nudicaule TaxID=74823 RepID=A0AA41V693_PAPNU|nr:hypothetical protein [Papaver nudicaule]